MFARTGAMVSAMLVVLAINASYAALIMLGLMKNVQTDDGPDEYAEKPSAFMAHYFPSLPMPLNTLINLGYILAGLRVIKVIHTALKAEQLTQDEAYCGYVFGWMAVIYGPIQLGRILTQDHSWAVADQWATLPIFSWVVTWGLVIQSGWSTQQVAAITAVSVMSYLLTLVVEVGFEVALCGHILAAVAMGVWHLMKTPTQEAVNSFSGAILCCTGFVVFKLLDHHLAGLHWIFTVISGHFLSKIADFMQFWFVTDFFIAVSWHINKNRDRKAPTTIGEKKEKGL